MILGKDIVLMIGGTPLAAADHTEQTLIAEIDLNRVDEVRAQLPTFLHLREDLYTVAN